MSTRTLTRPRSSTCRPASGTTLGGSASASPGKWVHIDINKLQPCAALQPGHDGPEIGPHLRPPSSCCPQYTWTLNERSVKSKMSSFGQGWPIVTVMEGCCSTSVQGGHKVGKASGYIVGGSFGCGFRRAGKMPKYGKKGSVPDSMSRLTPAIGNEPN